MNKWIFLFFLILLFPVTIVFTSCENDLDFTTSSNDRLAFSTDTVSFDTVFTTIGSSTRTLMLYNKHSKALNISSIKVANGENSGFYINVDGMKGYQFNDIEIWKNDSLYINIEVTVDPTKKDEPVLKSDSIIFVTNGVTQIVHLLAYGQDVTIWKGKIIEQDTTLTGNKPFLIYDSLVVASNTTLTLEKGTILYFHDKANVLVKGNIKAKGTWEEPVVFRGDRSDDLYTGLSYDHTPGQWGGIYLYGESYHNEFEHTYIRNGSYGIFADSSDITIPKIYLKNSILHNVSGDLIAGKSYNIKAENCQLTNAKGAIVRLLGGNGRFIQCTLANYFGFSSRQSPSLVLKNYVVLAKDQFILYPIEQATFDNCIIYGSMSSSGEILLDNEYDKSPVPAAFNHRFNRCLLGANGEDDENFIQTIWNKNPQFNYLNKDNDFVYKFQLDSASVARNYGDMNIAFNYPTDITGKSRIQDAGPDLGCYEY